MRNFEKLIQKNNSGYKDICVVNESDDQIVVVRIVNAQKLLSQVLGCKSLSVLYQQNQDKATVIHGERPQCAHSLIESDGLQSLLCLSE